MICLSKIIWKQIFQTETTLLVNSKSLGLEVYFRIIRKSSYREVDIQIVQSPKMIIFPFDFHQTCALAA